MGRGVFQTSPAYSPMSKSVQIGGLCSLFAYYAPFKLVYYVVRGLDMGKWITDNARLEKSPKPNKWYLLDNELYQDDDGAIYLVPRNYETDNYSIPDWVAMFAGNKSKWSVRPSHLHDFGCQYKQLIKVKLNESGLRKLRYLKVHGDKLVCENIPTKYLSLIPVTKWEIDCMFKRMMKATKTIPARVYNTYRVGVFFNVGWLTKKKAYNLNNIYTRISENE